MLVTLKEALADAEKNNYGIGMYGCYNMESIRAIIEAGEETRSPVILGFAEGHIQINKILIEDICHPLVQYAKRATVPVVVHLDHGFTFENIVKAIHCGFSSVMIDASQESFEKNASMVSEITKIARVFNCSVEAELGHVGGQEAMNDATESSDRYFTIPQEAARFAEETGIDALAVAIGTIHGPYKKQPALDLIRLEEINKMTKIPLVLHGGSGLSDQDFQATIDRGVRKINIFTDLSMAGYQGSINLFQSADSKNMLTLTESMVAAIKAKVMAYTHIFRSYGKA